VVHVFWQLLTSLIDMWPIPEILSTGGQVDVQLTLEVLSVYVNFGVLKP
jgi:hypothetical protein